MSKKSLFSTLKNAISRQIFELWGRPTPRMKWEIELLLFNFFLDTTNQFENLTDQPIICLTFPDLF